MARQIAQTTRTMMMKVQMLVCRGQIRQKLAERVGCIRLLSLGAVVWTSNKVSAESGVIRGNDWKWEGM